ncbi:MAG: formate/nitrite transporter family protein [Coriobacteriales bacterium]|jgi:formate/nitrite transporter|nr:formate/nitrite transporter family protein [Coriobacteriales bacterium]
MSNSFNTPTEVAEVAVNAGVAKANMGTVKTVLLALLAGAAIAFGAAASSVAIHDVGNVGLARLIAGCVFPVGLMLIVIVGGELFTGNCLMVEALCDRKIRAMRWLRNLVLVYVGNFIGSVLIVALVIFSNQLNYTDSLLGAFTIKVALGKISMPPLAAFSSGILCNMLVCGAVLMAFAARDIPGKVLGIFFPIMAFILSGFEHCVANMYFIPAGIAAAANPVYADKAMEVYGYTTETLAKLDVGGFFSNIVPVTLGNVVGGVALGLVLFAAFRSKALNK